MRRDECGMIGARELLLRGSVYLEAHGVPDAAWDAWLLLEHVTNLSRAQVLADPARPLPEAERQQYLELLEKRGQRVPLQHLTGVQEFMGFPFFVNEDVLVPRQDTEILVEQALARLPLRPPGSSYPHLCGGSLCPSDTVPAGLYAGDAPSPDSRVLDLCTGSGCIAISLKKLHPTLRIDAADISERALRVARRNARALEAEVRWMQGDLFEALSGTAGSAWTYDTEERCEEAYVKESQAAQGKESQQAYDMIVSNPPYIPTAEISSLEEEVRCHEPVTALDGHADGLSFYRRITAESSGYLRPGGWLLFEIGWNQAAAVRSLMEEAGYFEIETIKDLAGLDRVIAGRLSEQ